MDTGIEARQGRMRKEAGSPFGAGCRRVLVAVLAAGFAWVAGPPAARAAEVELLTAKLTVGATATEAGFAASLGSMTDTIFTYDGTDYQIESLTVSTPASGDGELRFSVNLNIPTNLKRSLELTLDSTSFSGSAAAIAGGALTWTNPGLTWSDNDEVAVVLKAVERPAAPASLTATPGDGEVALSWTDPGDDTIDEWQYRVKAGDGSFDIWSDIDPSDADTTSHTVENLTNGTAYTFEVRAVNEGGDGAASSVTATPNIQGTWSFEAVLDPSKIAAGGTGARFSVVAIFQVDADDIADVHSLSATSPEVGFTASVPRTSPQRVGFAHPVNPSYVSALTEFTWSGSGATGRLCSADLSAGTLTCPLRASDCSGSR